MKISFGTILFLPKKFTPREEDILKIKTDPKSPLPMLKLFLFFFGKKNKKVSHLE